MLSCWQQCSWASWNFCSKPFENKEISNVWYNSVFEWSAGPGEISAVFAYENNFYLCNFVNVKFIGWVYM